MIMHSAATRTMRLLSDAEIAMVAGGPGPDDWIDPLVDRDHMVDLTPDRAIVQSVLNGEQAVFYDSNHNGRYDTAWLLHNGAWICSSDGNTWNSCESPDPFIAAYWQSHYEEWNNVNGG